MKYLIKTIFKPDLYTFYENFRKVLEEHDIEFDFYVENIGVNSVQKDHKYSFILHFEGDIVVTNESNIKHVIKDIFIRVCVKNDGTIVLGGTKSLWKKREVIHGYIHSHIQKFNPETESFTWCNLCLGSSDLHVLKMIILKEPTYQNCFIFLHYLQTFIKTESVEGVPYIKISSLYADSEKDSPYYTNKILLVESFLLNFIKMYPIYNPLMSNIYYNYSSNNIEIYDEEEFKNVIKEMCKILELPVFGTYVDFEFKDFDFKNPIIEKPRLLYSSAFYFKNKYVNFYEIPQEKTIVNFNDIDVTNVDICPIFYEIFKEKLLNNLRKHSYEKNKNEQQILF